MRKKIRIQKMIILAVIVFFCSIFLYQSRQAQVGSIEQLFSYFAYPFLKLQVTVVNAATEILSDWSHMLSLESDYKKIRAERDDLRAQLIALQAMCDVKEETKELREFAQQYENTACRLVRILEKQYGSEGHFFLVEGGTTQGIKKDMAVVYKNCLVGKVSEVFAWYSKVILITDPCCKVAAYCQQTKTVGIYQGKVNKLRGSLDHVGHLSVIAEGDMVFSSGEGLVFPRGFGIGTITAFSKNEGDMHYTIEVKPLLDLTMLSYCYVLEKTTELV